MSMKLNNTIGIITMTTTLIACILLQKSLKKLKKINNQNDKTIAIKKISRKMIILYGTTTGTAKLFAYKLYRKVQMNNINIEICDIKDYDEEKIDKEDMVFLICSTYTNGEPPTNCKSFVDYLLEYAYDFRVSKNYLHSISYAIFGLGGELYGNNYCKAVKDIDSYMSILGAKSMLPLSYGDDASDLEEKFGRWCSSILQLLGIDNKQLYTSNNINDDNTTMINDEYEGISKRKHKRLLRTKEVSIADIKRTHSSSQTKSKIQTKPNTSIDSKPISQSLTTSTCCNNTNNTDVMNSNKTKSTNSNCGCSTNSSKIMDSNNNTIHEDINPNLEDDDEEEEEDIINNKYVNMDDDNDDEHGGIIDLEDMGKVVMDPKVKDDIKMSLMAEDPSIDTRREMITKLQRKSLTKEGYKIIGTHSAVKLCRWTKNQLRGRGGCYKHTFYGITSYQCMEATPSLACANKCVFCWRHHKNPVGTEWRWKEDPPEHIVQEAIRLHQSMINEMRGVPGVQPDRLKEALTVKHCALSLVGEPIMYPGINKMLQELHDRSISTFLVTNAQFPEHIRDLDPITQLYVSIDASTRDSLKAIDRPLFKDFWERFLASLNELKNKQQRTVYRMTLVKSWNMNETEGYAELIESGQPDFIEIKAMTYCGKSDASSLTMQNVPWHQEVCAYGEALCQRLAQRNHLPYHYNVATEHEHSCCILIAREDKFKVDSQWYTWINYPVFNQLIQKYYESNGLYKFTSIDYMLLTPEWALYQSKARGFDPIEQRWHRNKTTGALVEIPYEATDSGCG